MADELFFFFLDKLAF